MELIVGKSYKFENVIERFIVTITDENETGYFAKVLESNSHLHLGKAFYLSKKHEVFTTHDIMELESEPSPELKYLYIDMALQTRDCEWFNKLMKTMEVVV